MTWETYKLASRKISGLCFIAWLGVWLPLFGVLLFAADRISNIVSFDRVWVFLMATPLLLGAICLGGWVMQVLDRRIGLRCPGCGSSLTLRCDPRRIVSSGACPFCQETLFAGTHEAVIPISPLVRTWLSPTLILNSSIIALALTSTMLFDVLSRSNGLSALGAYGPESMIHPILAYIAIRLMTDTGWSWRLFIAALASVIGLGLWGWAAYIAVHV
jgi:hypothetical protein